MIQDLTADGDFRGQMGLGLADRIAQIQAHIEEMQQPHDELVLTGTAQDREQKRYILECERDREGRCDCCGRLLRIRPWDFEEPKTLCSTCEEALEHLHGEFQERHMLNEVIDEAFHVRVIKPWDMPRDERDNAVDNVLLWD